MTASPSTLKAMQLQIDSLADEVKAAGRSAGLATSGLAHHEDICTLRYEGIEKAQTAQTETLKDIARSLKELDEKRGTDTRGIYSRFWWFAGAIGACMFAIIMALVFKH